MSNDELGLTFGLTQGSNQRFRDWAGHFSQADSLLRAQIDPFMANIAMEFESHARQEFIDGGHNDRPTVVLDSGLPSPHTIDTFHTEKTGEFTYEFTAGLGAAFVEFGRPDIDMTGMGYALHWIDPFSEEDVYSYHSKAVPPDDFIGRAEEDMDLHGQMSQLALGYFSEMTRTGDYGLNVGQHA